MKKLTLETYERIIDSVHEKSKSHPDMEIGDGTRFNCAEYIGFYALHGGLYWSEQDGKIRGVATAHPGKKDFSWDWGVPDGIWTTHLVWADNIQSHAEVLQSFLNDHHVTQLWTWRGDAPVELTHKKLQRLFSYGKRQHNNSSATGTSVQRVDEEHSSGSGGDGSESIRAGVHLSAQIRPATISDRDPECTSPDGLVPEASASVFPA